MSRLFRLFLFLLVVAAFSWGVYECKYYYSYYADLKDRPWAYSRDEKKPLLVGRWQGKFRDPDNVSKTVLLTIKLPVSDQERASKAARFRGKQQRFASHNEKKRFAGSATVTGASGTETYEFHGQVRTEDGHQLGTIQFYTAEGMSQVRTNFNLHSAVEGGRWNGDKLTLTVGFTYTTATGASHWNSSDPRFDKKVVIHLSRVKP
ncbi:MAG: hypothetical protein BGO21_02210 [Dyadobacter sp. 50-39]|uniref:hypothetical protein n=1 Tax=Dyadobacter sp. 50-39 TaxID=1895756 RepID=UPI0009675F66|nr:hypothetical protein [Dyadobacter sp. 50-39]OJV12583.1 MAG: hypothetical protein BGO21_02210 [Dyadobacter sp. 50-39]